MVQLYLFRLDIRWSVSADDATIAVTVANAVTVAAAAVADAMKYYILAFCKEVYCQRVPQFVVTRGSLSVLTKYFRSWTEIFI